MTRSDSRFQGFAALVAGAVMFSGQLANASSGTWTGAENAIWTNSANWSVSPYAGYSTSEKATFDSAGNNNTTLDITGLYSIGSMTFDSPSVAAYTIGTGALNSQTLIMGGSGTYYMTSTAGNNQLINATLQLGGSNTTGSYFFRNESTAKTMTFAGNIGSGTGSTAGTKTMSVYGAGNIVFSGNLDKGTASALVLTNGLTGTLTLSGSNTLTTLYITGNSSTVTDIGSGYLFLNNAGTVTLYSMQGGVISGTGKIRLSTAGGANYADNYIATGKTLVINPSITGSTGFEMWSGAGTFVFNGINDFTENVILGTAGTLSVSLVGNQHSTTSNLGQGTNITFNTSGARLLYTGAGETSDRILNFKGNAIVDQSGSGNLNFSTPVTCSSGGKTVTLQGSTAGTGEFSGALRNDLGALAITKAGTGTWRFSAANTYTGLTTVAVGTLILSGANGAIASSGAITVSAGATLQLDNTAAANNASRLSNTAPISLNGSTLIFSNDGGSANFTEAAGALTISQFGNTISTSQAGSGQTATLTFASLTRSGNATLMFSGPGLGESDRNRIFITGQADGPIGSWATVNGSPAYYSSTQGVYVSSLVGIAARGDVIVSNAVSNVRINSDGTNGPITLSHLTTVVNSLAQTTATDATVDTAGKTLQVSAVSIDTGKANLTLGVSQGDGIIATPTAGGDLAVMNNGTSALTVNAVIADNGAPSSLTKSGNGPLVLAGANTFSGAVTVNQGSISLANSFAFQNIMLGSLSGIAFDSSVASHAFTLGGLTNSFALALADNAANPIALSAGNNNAESSFGGVLSGSGSLNKVGAGTLTLTAANTFSGGLKISQGTLVTAQASGLGTAAVTNNATLNLTGGGVTYTGLSTAMAGAGTVNVTLGTTTASTTLNGDYSGFTGTWNLGLAGTGGKAVMNGADNSAATINVLSNGTLYASAIGTHNATAVLYGGNTGEPNGQLRLEASSEWAGPVLLAGDITDSADGHFGSGAGTGIVSGVIGDISGAHPVKKVGSARVVFTGTTNTYAGPTWVSAGTLGATSLKNVGTASSLGRPANATDGTIKMGTGSTAARLAYLGTGDTTDRIVDMAGTTGAAYLEQAGSGLLKFTGNLTSSGVGSKSLYLDGSSSGIGELAGVFADGSGGANKLVKSGSGKWIVSNVNTHSGETEVQSGTLVLTHPNALANSSTVRFTGTSQNNAVLEVATDGTGETITDITIGVGYNGTLASGVGTGSNGINHAVGDLSLSLVTLTVARASSVLSGTPSITAKSVSLSGGNAYTTMLNPTTADLILGSACITGNSYAKTLRLDGTSAGNMITGPVSNGINTCSLLKDNTSIWTLQGSNTYSGATTVNKGTLVLSGPNGSIASSSGVTINSGATLRLSNTVSGNVTNRLRDAAAVTLNGGVLDFAHTADAVDYSETLGAVTVASGTNTLSVSQAASGQTSTVTLSSLTRSAGATFDFSGTGLGADTRNKIFINGQADGLVGFWATYNGAKLALYDSVSGVCAGTFNDTAIAARGPSSTIPNDPVANVQITTTGTSGMIELEGATESRVAILQQSTATPAVVNTQGKTLRAAGIMINAGQESLTLGAAEGDGTLTALTAGGKIELENDSTTALTNSAATKDYTSPSSIAKNGTGPVVLKGACSYSGATFIGAGSLTFGSSSTQALVGAISGPGDLVKAGTNVLTLAGRNTYTGTTYINEGIVLTQTNSAFGSSAAGTIIASGATLDVGAALAANNLNLGSEQFTVSGAGVDGKGAIVNNSATSQYNAFGKINLAGDTTFGGAQSNGRWDLRNNTPTLNMNNYTLTKVGPNMVGLYSTAVTPGSGNIVVAQGSMRFEQNVKLNGSSANTFTVRNGAVFELYSHYPQNASVWTLILDDGATLSATQGAGTSNNWAGPVTLNGAALMNGGTYAHTISGDISGPGSIIKFGTTTTYLTSDNNTYSGCTWITNGTLSATSIKNVGAASSALGAPATSTAGTIKIGGGTSGATLIYAGTGDTTDRILDLAGTTGGATLNHSGTGLLKFTSGVTASGIGSKTLTLISTTSGSGEIAGALINSSASGKTAINKTGTGAWTLSGNNSYTGDVNISTGTLTLSGTNVQGSGSVNVGAAAGDSVMNLMPGSSLTGTYGIRIGHATGSSAALYMTGGSVARTPVVGNDLAFTMGRLQNSYGFFKMTGGDMNITRIQTGASSSGTNCIGVVRMTGGTLTLPDYMLLARGVSTLSAFTLDGGIIYHTNALNNLSIGYEGGRGELNITGGTLESYGKPLTVRQSANNPTGIVNLCAGALSVDAFQNTAPGVALLNFMGGTLKSGTNSTVFIPAAMNGVYSYGSFGTYAGGAVIDTLSRTNTVAAPIRAPTGNGVYSITLATQGSGYIGEPYVAITGSDGVGATAVANMADDGMGSNTFKVASVTITCPGVDYIAVPTVSFLGGGTYAVAPTVGTVTLSPGTSGGLTKLGTGTLTLSAANTYTGATTVSSGTLKLGVANALLPNTQVSLNGGTLDLSGFTVTNAVSGAGAITNGTLIGVLSPAGEGVPGTNTLSLKSVTLKGTYMADVAAAGISDLVAVQGNVNLSGLALQIVNTDLLDIHQVYTILTCTGTRSGTFSSTNLSGSRWHVIYLSDGTVKLFYTKGTLMIFQ